MVAGFGRRFAALAGAAWLLWSFAFATALSAQETERASGAEAPLTIVYVGRTYPKPQYLSLLQTSPDDLGEAGVRLAMHEIELAGRFLDRRYDLRIVRIADGADAKSQLHDVFAPSSVIVADLEPRDLLALADLPEARRTLILDMRTSDDGLRQEQCRRNTFHLLPSVAMRADALGQYLVAKRWSRWLVLQGTGPQDAAYAADVARTAKRFGAHIVEDRSYAYDAGSRRVDTGYQQIQTQMPLATRNAAQHDVLFVADTSDVFGDYLPYATADARPVVGTQGLVATAWSPAFQEYSALQMQHRFQVAAHRPMQEADYAGWLAVRAIGEAATRARTSDAGALADFMRSPDFSVAGFKGQALTFRSWDQQLRQPVLLASPLMVVSMSPQDAFLHPKFLTDTLGFDEPETRCHLAS